MKKMAVEVADLEKGDDKDSTSSQMFRCPFWDCGWCYSDVIGENGCIGIEKCRIKHKSKWDVGIHDVYS